MASSVREAQQSILNVLVDPEVLLDEGDRDDLRYAVGLLDDYLPDDE